MVIYSRYFKSPRTSMIRMKSDYSSFGGRKLSPYDKLIKDGAEQLGWDWRLLAALVFEESQFNPSGESWAGAQGLMQLMPATARHFGAVNVNDPKQSIKAGVRYLKFLDKLFTKSVPDPLERLKFVLAAYNVGHTHVLDAQKLTRKYGHDPSQWHNHVEQFLLKKGNPKYYRDPSIVAGYCKCEEPVHYVKNIMARYEEYRMHIDG
jgi:membrane-bound lytic murein transglycosylase F